MEDYVQKNGSVQVGILKNCFKNKNKVNSRQNFFTNYFKTNVNNLILINTPLESFCDNELCSAYGYSDGYHFSNYFSYKILSESTIMKK